MVLGGKKKGGGGWGENRKVILVGNEVKKSWLLSLTKVEDKGEAKQVIKV